MKTPLLLLLIGVLALSCRTNRTTTAAINKCAIKFDEVQVAIDMAGEASRIGLEALNRYNLSKNDDDLKAGFQMWGTSCKFITLVVTKAEDHMKCLDQHKAKKSYLRRLNQQVDTFKNFQAHCSEMQHKIFHYEGEQKTGLGSSGEKR